MSPVLLNWITGLLWIIGIAVVVYLSAIIIISLYVISERLVAYILKKTIGDYKLYTNVPKWIIIIVMVLLVLLVVFLPLLLSNLNEILLRWEIL